MAENKTLDILAIENTRNYLKFFGYSELESEKIYRRLSNEAKNSNGFWYLHGQLQSLVKFDKGLIVNLHIDDMAEDGRMPHIAGIFDVSVRNVDEPCVGYFYIDSNGLCRGLVCLKSDEMGIREAQRHYEEKSIIL